MKNNHRSNSMDECCTVGPHYEAVERWCHDVVSSGNELLFDPILFTKELFHISEQFQFPSVSLLSFLRNISVGHVKKMAPIVKRNLPKYVTQYWNGTSIKELARIANYPPYLFARYMVESLTNLKNVKKGIAEAMRNPEKELCHIEFLIPNASTALVGGAGSVPGGGVATGIPCSQFVTEMADIQKSKYEQLQKQALRLASEVKEAIVSDPMYGPMHDKERHMIGIEYEVLLEKGLEAMNIPFETEAELRDKGTARTPDILLSVPLGILVPKKDGSGGNEWKVVCWIDSKALFGDEYTHRTSVLPQAESYVHRFGPGLVLYWFGHAPMSLLGDAHGDITLAAWEIPRNLIWPTGEMVSTVAAIPRPTRQVDDTDNEKEENFMSSAKVVREDHQTHLKKLQRDLFR